MAPPRLHIALREGEAAARIGGFTKFPIDPIAIAKSKDVGVTPKPADVKGCSGALLIAGGAAQILYSSEYGNAGFERFCIGHELGHYCLSGHPEQILAAGGKHYSNANFTEVQPIEIEADHFACGLLMPTTLTKAFLADREIGMDTVLALADEAICSRTAAAIRAAQCSPYPLAIIVSRGDAIAYAFTSDSFKRLGKLAFLRKGTALPTTVTREFNSSADNVTQARRMHAETCLSTWFNGPKTHLDEEVLGLGRYGYTLTVLSSERLTGDPEEDEDEDAEIEQRWTPRFAYGR